jgi:hypothetical protein
MLQEIVVAIILPKSMNGLVVDFSLIGVPLRGFLLQMCYCTAANAIKL